MLRTLVLSSMLLALFTKASAFGQALVPAAASRPYTGFPAIPGLTGLIPRITITRLEGAEPFVVQVHAAGTKGVFSDGGAAFQAKVGRPFDSYSDLDFSWDFGDPDGTEDMAHPVTGKSMDANTDQTGGHAAYVYRAPGAYTITLTARAWDGSKLIAASTTALRTEEFQQFSIRNNPTGGTYRVRFGGAMTAPVAWNARCDEVQAALQALPTIGAGNVEVYGGVQPTASRPFHVYFTGDLAGADMPLLEANLLDLTMRTAAPEAKIREEAPGSSAAVATCNAFSGETRYFDSRYVDKPDDGAQGTIERPFTTYSQMRLWIMGGTTMGMPTAQAPNRRTLLKRGSVWEVPSSISFEGGKNGCRIGTYGEGPRPRIRRPTGNVLYWATSYDSATNGANVDFVVDGLEVESDSDMTVQGMYGTSGITANFFGLPRNLHFLDCKILGGSAVALGITDLAFWRCAFDKSPDSDYMPGMKLAMGTVRWGTVVGCKFDSGGKRLRDGIPILDHHIYPTNQSLALFRWIDFNLSNACNYCINNNAGGLHLGNPKLAPYHLIDGCDLTGTQNGLDFSSTKNDPNDSYIDRIVVQDCAFHVGTIGRQGYGILAYNPALITLRDNAWYTNQAHDIMFSGNLRSPQIYRNASWRTSGAFLRCGGGPGAWIEENTLWNDCKPSGGPVGLMTIYPANRANWRIDRNRYGSPAPQFWDATGNKKLTTAQWQAMGLDQSSEFQATPFGWTDPAHGNFKVPLASLPEAYKVLFEGQKDKLLADPGAGAPALPDGYKVLYQGRGMILVRTKD